MVEPDGSGPLIRSFSSLEEATAAQAALLADGVDAQAVELRVIDDEAGPVEGNFVIGNGRTAHGGPPGGIRTGPQVPYEENFQDSVHRGGFLLIVSVAQEQRSAVQDLLERFDAVDVGRV